MSAPSLVDRPRVSVSERLAIIRRLPGVVATAWVILIVAVLAMAFGGLVAPHPPNLVDLSNTYAGPSPSYLLGTDSLGRDILSRLLVGARSALLGPLAVAAIAAAVGVVIAVTMAWRGGVTDAVGARGLDVLLAFPGLLAAILAVAIFGHGFLAPAIALALVYLPYVTRVIRASALKERSLPYMAALTVQGLSTWRIITRHLIPNIVAVIISQAVVSASYALIDLAALSYLGLGVQPPAADWGLMVANGQASVLSGYPQESIFAGACIVAVIVSLNIIGEYLSDGTEGRHA